MRAGAVFSEEKVLYFADQEQLFHLQPDEPEHSDANHIVSALCRSRMLEQVSSGDSGRFFKITPKGKRRLLRLQIEYRRQHGKPTDGHEALLRDLCSEEADVQ